MSYTSRLKQTSILVATTLLLTACGGGGSGGVETNTSTPATQTPTNHAPIIQDYSITTNEDTPRTLTLSGSDADGDSLTYTIKKQPSHGTINGNTYTPAKDYHGKDSFTFIANDGKADSKVATVSITVIAVNDAPIATAQSLTTNEDTDVSFTLSGSDADGDSLTYTIKKQPSHGTINGNTYTPAKDYNGKDSFTFVANDGKVNSQEATVSIHINATPIAQEQNLTTDEDTDVSFTLSGSDEDGDTLTYKIKKQPSHGTINGNTYTPAKDYHGKDSFTFVANDGKVDSQEATVSIIINSVNDAPVVESNEYTFNEDNNTRFSMRGSDVDGDKFTYRIVSWPKHGYIYNGYHPYKDYNGEDSITYQAFDGKVWSEVATLTFHVTPVNDAPFANNSNLKTDKNTDISVELNATDVDNDNNTLSYEIIKQPEHGTISGSEKSYTYTPEDGFTGLDSFSYKATDADSASDEGRVYVSVGIPMPYITLWKTDNEGNTTDTQIKIDTHSGDNYNFTVDWGDGNIDRNITGDIIHTYDTAGIYTVAVSGEYPHSQFGNYSNTSYDAKKLLSVEQWGEGVWKSMYYAYLYCANMQDKATDVPNLSQVGSMYRMFSGATSFNQDISNWDVSNVKSMEEMFLHATSFNQDISNWDVSNVTDMRQMFLHATSFNQDIGDWDVSNVINMSQMFSYTTSFNQDIGSWNVSNVTGMSYMFSGAYSFNQDIGDWDVSNVTNMPQMFLRATSFNQAIGNWDVSQVTNMNLMFENATSFDQNLSKWDVSSVQATGTADWQKGMYRMFYGVTLSTPNYDALLKSWSGQNLHDDISFDGGNSRYSADAQAARDTLTNDHNWTVTDGGVE